MNAPSPRQQSPSGSGKNGSSLATDVRVVGARLYFLPIETRVPLKFGGETLTSVTCARAEVTIEDSSGRRAKGWGETPLNIEWVWPSSIPYHDRLRAVQDFAIRLASRWAGFELAGHPLEIGHAFQESVLSKEIENAGSASPDAIEVPLLAALLCCAPYDCAVYDAYGNLHGKRVFETLGPDYLSHDLEHFLPAEESDGVCFAERYPSDYLVQPRESSLPAWHLVGGLDPISSADLTGAEPQDGLPVLLNDWIEKDGLQCLKVKLRGVDWQWDFQRLISVGEVAQATGVEHLTADFNCTVTEPSYVVKILDRLEQEAPQVLKKLLYIEQPFPRHLEDLKIDVRAVSERMPLLLDESAHDWRHVRLGYSLGWNGVALKTCKTLSGALLSLCWARAHDMHIMVQDLTNPMLAQIPHVLLAAHCDTMLGVETNAMQFYPAASDCEARVHPELYRRRNGRVDFSTLSGPGFGYRVEEIGRQLPDPVVEVGFASADS